MEALEPRRLFAGFEAVNLRSPEIEVTTPSGELIRDNVATVEFGSVRQGQLGPTRSFIVRNRGTADLTLGKLNLPVGYRIVDNLVDRLRPGGSDVVTIRLDSATPGVKNGQLFFLNNDRDENPFNFALQGQVIPGVAPEIEVSLPNGQVLTDGLSTVDFGSVQQGQTGPTRSFIVRNRGNADLTLGNLTVPAGFRIVDGLVPRLVPGAFDTITIQLETTTAGLKSGQLVIPNNDSDESPFDFNIVGRVTPIVGPEIEVTTTNGTPVTDGVTTIDFGTIFQLSAGSVRSFIVRNRGTTDLTLGPVFVPQGFRVLDGLVSRLAPGASDVLTIRMDAIAPGIKSGQVSFNNNDADESPFNFKVTGRVLPYNRAAFVPANAADNERPATPTSQPKNAPATRPTLPAGPAVPTGFATNRPALNQLNSSGKGGSPSHSSLWAGQDTLDQIVSSIAADVAAGWYTTPRP